MGWLADPNRLEETAMSGVMCIAVNQYGELCGIHKPGGMPVDFALIQQLKEVAISRAKEFIAKVQTEVEADLERRRLKLRNVHRQYNEEQLLSVDLSTPTDAARSSTKKDEDIDINAELAAVAAEAAEIEEQLAAATA